MDEHLERMRALVAQALAEAVYEGGASIAGVHLVLYGGFGAEAARMLFTQAALGTPAERAALHLRQTGSRYICWNCCGLRFESDDGICPNCGEAALEVPGEIAFGLDEVTFD